MYNLRVQLYILLICGSLFFIITDFLLQDCFKTVKENLVLYLLITIKLFIFLSRSFYYIHTQMS